ncbi:MAG: hypothetical protein JST31_15995 [Actinobacteria bacterium]|nr:hypothetical protein [Actinomycetota bacterium]
MTAQSRNRQRRSASTRAAVMLALAVIAFAVAAAALAGAAMASKGGGTLPAGFPYAAEIQATIRYDGTYTRDTTSTVACGTSSEGTTVTAPVRTHETVHFDRTLFFRHITVPVATPGELGRAAAKLGLEPTVTTPGQIRNDHSSMELEYTSTEGENEACRPTAPATCFWSLLPVPSSAMQAIVAHHNGVVPAFWTVSVLGANSTTGDCPVNNGPDQLSALLEDAGQLSPPALAEGFPNVTISHGLSSDFHRLKTQPRVRFEVNLDLPASGSSNCSTNLNPEQGTCTNGVTGRAEVELHRLFFYESKKPYRR